MLNGWSDEEIDRLARKTSAPRERVEAFCRAVDKRLYMLLDERQRRATLHFHLRPAARGDEPGDDPGRE